MGLWIDRFGLTCKKLAGIMNTFKGQTVHNSGTCLKKICTPKKKPVIS